MSLITLLAVFGLLHVAAYTVVGFSLAFIVFVNWTARQFRLKAEMIRIYRAMLQARYDAKHPGA